MNPKPTFGKEYHGEKKRAEDYSMWAHINEVYAKYRLVVALATLIAGGMGFVRGYIKLAGRTNVLEANQIELKSFVRFLVVDKCLEADSTKRRELAQADVDCQAILSPNNTRVFRRTQ